METSNINFAYLRDPANKLRVVTFAWKEIEEAKLDSGYRAVEYSYAINKVVSPRNEPWRTRKSEQHNKKTARTMTAGRLKSDRYKQKAVVETEKAIQSIMSDFIYHISSRISWLRKKGVVPTPELFIRDVLERIRDQKE